MMKSENQPSSRPLILELDHVQKDFFTEKKEKLRAVYDVSLKLYAGECLAIVGESGCGKTTLARMIAGIEPVTRGSIWFQGKDITHLSKQERREVRQQMQLVFQNPASAFSPRMKIGQFMKEPLLNYHLTDRKHAHQEAVRLLEKVELDGSYMDQFPHQLSGGQLQRVVIARALAVHPALLICDEATSALDVSIQAQILRLLKKIQEEEHIGILFICHDLALVQQFAQRMAVMYLGSIMEEMESRLLSQAVHPYTCALLHSVFSVHGSREKEIQVLEGEPPSPLKLHKGCPFAGRCPEQKPVCAERKPEPVSIGENHMVRCFMKRKTILADKKPTALPHQKAASCNNNEYLPL